MQDQLNPRPNPARIEARPMLTKSPLVETEHVFGGDDLTVT